MKSEIHLFVLWEKARGEEKKILSDMRNRFSVLAEIEAQWPAEVGAEKGFRRFYGTFLPNAAAKARNAGEGAFLIVVVCDPSPVYEMVETVRGTENVDVNIFRRKYVYRDWVGGHHRVHGTNSTAEARRDVMLLTGHPLEEWIDGTAIGKPMTVLPGQGGWRSMGEMFAFLNETIPYVVLREGEYLPEGIGFGHDIDLLVPDKSDAVGLLNAEKQEGWDALYAVKVGGKKINLDFGYVGDGCFDEGWQREMLRHRTRTAKGVYVLSPLNYFYSLTYRAVFQKKKVLKYHLQKLEELSREVDGSGNCFDEWVRSLLEFIKTHGYTFPKPKGRRIRSNKPLQTWRVKAEEAKEVLGVRDIWPADFMERAFGERVMTENIFYAHDFDGNALRVEYGTQLRELGEGEFRMAKIFAAAVPDLAVAPVCWHWGREGSFMVYEQIQGMSFRARLEYGPELGTDEAESIAVALLRMADVLRDIGLVHRDIRPENIWLGEDGKIRLRGFRFAVDRRSYRKECSTLRKDPLNRLAKIGGDFVAEPGVWNDAVSFARCLEKLPATEKVRAAISELNALAERTKPLCVRLPAKVRIRLFFVWLKFAIADLLRPHSRAAAKHAVCRRFAWNAVRC